MHTHIFPEKRNYVNFLLYKHVDAAMNTHNAHVCAAMNTHNIHIFAAIKPQLIHVCAAKNTHNYVFLEEYLCAAILEFNI